METQCTADDVRSLTVPVQSLEKKRRATLINHLKLINFVKSHNWTGRGKPSVSSESQSLVIHGHTIKTKVCYYDKRGAGHPPVAHPPEPDSFDVLNEWPLRDLLTWGGSSAVKTHFK